MASGPCFGIIQSVSEYSLVKLLTTSIVHPNPIRGREVSTSHGLTKCSYLSLDLGPLLFTLTLTIIRFELDDKLNVQIREYQVIRKSICQQALSLVKV